jgi:hypothetical protein
MNADRMPSPMRRITALPIKLAANRAWQIDPFSSPITGASSHSKKREKRRSSTPVTHCTLGGSEELPDSATVQIRVFPPPPERAPDQIASQRSVALGLRW